MSTNYHWECIVLASVYQLSLSMSCISLLRTYPVYFVLQNSRRDVLRCLIKKMLYLYLQELWGILLAVRTFILFRLMLYTYMCIYKYVHVHKLQTHLEKLMLLQWLDLTCLESMHILWPHKLQTSVSDTCGGTTLHTLRMPIKTCIVKECDKQPLVQIVC